MVIVRGIVFTIIIAVATITIETQNYIEKDKENEARCSRLIISFEDGHWQSNMIKKRGSRRQNYGE